MKRIVFLLFAVFCLGIGRGKAQFSVLLNFDSLNGENPLGSLVISHNKLYGMTLSGGKYDLGCIFYVDTNGTGYKDLFDFNDTDGSAPFGSLIIAGKEMYGMTSLGGASIYGCIFRLDTSGNNYTVLHSFNDTLGTGPWGSLIITGNTLYGMTRQGGAYQNGIVFSLDTSGNNYKDIHDFTNAAYDGWPVSNLIKSGKVLYGMSYGIPDDLSVFNYGSIFSLDIDGSNYKVLHNFVDTTGYRPFGTLTLISGSLYGTTSEGLFDSGTIFSIDTNGNNYKVIFSFNGVTGNSPYCTLNAIGNNIYGMTATGGLLDGGCIFSIDDNGSGYSDLYDFPGNNFEPGSLIYSGDVLYGMSYYGGSSNKGTVFKFRQIDLGISKINLNDSKISIFPNPTTGIFTINFVGAQNPDSYRDEPKNIEIYNVLGERVETQCIASLQTTINLTNRPNGIYFYRIVSENGGLIGEGKIVKN